MNNNMKIIINYSCVESDPIGDDYEMWPDCLLACDNDSAQEIHVEPVHDKKELISLSKFVAKTFNLENFDKDSFIKSFEKSIRSLTKALNNKSGYPDKLVVYGTIEKDTLQFIPNTYHYTELIPKNHIINIIKNDNNKYIFTENVN